MILINLSIGFVLFIVLIIPFLKVSWKGIAAIVSVLTISIFSSIPAVNAIMGYPTDITIIGSYINHNIPVRIDALAGFFILLINFTSVTGVLYGAKYMKSYEHQTANLSLHWIQYVLFHASMIGVCIVQNSLIFLIVWEIMSLSSMLLVIFDHKIGNTLKAGINYLVQMHIGVIVLTMAFIWVHMSEGSYDFMAIRSFFISHNNSWLFLLFFIGFGIKAGFVPMHSWLPHAHPAAPSHVSGVMSGVIVKLGIFGILRIITLLHADFLLLGEIILMLSVSTGLYGIVNSAVHRDFKRMLAYCTIENIGIIGIGIGLGLIGLGKDNSLLIILGFGGALLHTLNHSLFKSLLFYAVGSVYRQTHTRDMDKLGGLIKKMPETALIFLIGAIAICGIPPLNGFVSEFIIYNGLLHGIHSEGYYHTTLMTISLAGLAIIGGVSLLAFTKNFGTIFLGNPRDKDHSEAVEVPLQMRIPQYVIILTMLSIGIFPGFYFSKICSIVAGSFPLNGNLVTGLTAPVISLLTKVGIFSALFIVIILFIYSLRFLVAGRKNIERSSTWGCGYVAPKVSMQYTGKSFSKPLGKIVGFLIPEHKKYKELKSAEVFPETRKYFSYYFDFFENSILDKITKRLLYFMNIFQFVQNGRIQMYILYGLFFILVVFIGSLFNFI